MERLRGLVSAIGRNLKATGPAAGEVQPGRGWLGLCLGCALHSLSLRFHLPAERIAQLLKFALVGMAGVAVNSGALVLFYEWVRLPLVVASAVAVEIAIVHNYLWNDRWTFGRHSLSARRFAKFNLVSLGGLVITTATLYGLSRGVGLHYMVANLAGISLAMVWNFGLNLLWTWGGRER